MALTALARLVLARACSRNTAKWLKQSLVLDELEPERQPDREVVRDRVTLDCHDVLPRRGRTRSRSLTQSTFA
jgi:hypothetical protein